VLPDKLRAWYTVPQLAGMAGTHRNDMRATLKAAGVPIDDTRKAGRVLLTDLRTHAPAVWESILMVVKFRQSEGGKAA
jgi:hypothetical protein